MSEVPGWADCHEEQSCSTCFIIISRIHPGCCADMCVYICVGVYICVCVLHLPPAFMSVCLSVCQSRASADCIITLMEAITSRCRRAFDFFFVHVRRLESGGRISLSGRHCAFDCDSPQQARRRQRSQKCAHAVEGKKNATTLVLPDKRFEAAADRQRNRQTDGRHRRQCET